MVSFSTTHSPKKGCGKKDKSSGKSVDVTGCNETSTLEGHKKPCDCLTMAVDSDNGLGE